MPTTEASLDEFVTQSDALGGPGSAACETYWADFQFEPRTLVDETLDPFSEAYVEQQLALFSEISGRDFDQEVNEVTLFALDTHVRAVNPYNHPDPAELAMHLQRLTKAFRLAGVRLDGRLLDMGCGWGLSSEVGAYLGLQVTAVDINPDFVALVTARAERSGLRIKAVRSAFDDYRPTESHDAVLFYECLHHAVRPWTIVRTMSESLAMPGGRLIIAGEPFNAEWWKHWGLRLDALSVYCIRKFGWFESGWSLDFMKTVFVRAGLSFELHSDPDPLIGYTVIGAPLSGGRKSMPELLAQTTSDNLHVELEQVLMNGRGSFEMPFPAGSQQAWLELVNYRGKPVVTEIRNGGTVIFQGEMPAGPNRILVPRMQNGNPVAMEAETWVPSQELDLPDDRQLSLHLVAVTFD